MLRSLLPMASREKVVSWLVTRKAFLLKIGKVRYLLENWIELKIGPGHSFPFISYKP